MQIISTTAASPVIGDCIWWSSAGGVVPAGAMAVPLAGDRLVVRPRLRPTSGASVASSLLRAAVRMTPGVVADASAESAINRRDDGVGATTTKPGESAGAPTEASDAEDSAASVTAVLAGSSSDAFSAGLNAARRTRARGRGPCFMALGRINAYSGALADSAVTSCPLSVNSSGDVVALHHQAAGLPLRKWTRIAGTIASGERAADRWRKGATAGGRHGFKEVNA